MSQSRGLKYYQSYIAKLKYHEHYQSFFDQKHHFELKVLKVETPMGGRADRAAKNAIEALVFFAPLAVLAHLAGMDAEVLLGAQIAFWARVAYVPIYIAGVKYVRSLVWIVGVVGYGMMVSHLL